MAKYCTQCGHKAEDGDRVCSNCGTFFPWIEEENKEKAEKAAETAKETVSAAADEAAEKIEQASAEIKETADAAAGAAAAAAAGAAAAAEAVKNSGAAQTGARPQQNAPQQQTNPYAQNPYAQNPYQNAPAQQEAPEKPRKAPKPVVDPPTDPKYTVVSTMAYFGLALVFSIPVIGFITCLIMTFAARNRNLRHFAASVLIWKVIGLLLTALIGVAVFLLAKSLSVALSAALKDGNFSDIVSSVFGEEAGEFIKGLPKDFDINGLISAALNGDREAVESYINELTSAPAEEATVPAT